MHMFAALGANIQMPPWPPPFMIMGRQGCNTVLKMTLSRGRLKCKKGGMMRTSLAWIQPHPHEAILRHIWIMVNLFLYSSTNYLENPLLPNDWIIVRNHVDDEEEVWDTKDVLEISRDVHNKVEIQTFLVQGINDFCAHTIVATCKTFLYCLFSE
jgi:hypothetical protein